MRVRLFLPNPDSKGNPLLEWIRQMKEKHPTLKTVESTIDGGDIRIVIDLQKETARVIGPRNSATMNATQDWFVEQVMKQMKEDENDHRRTDDNANPTVNEINREGETHNETD